MITLVEAKGYRCFKEIRQPLGPLHVLVGPNASGKSAFLDIFLFISDILREGLREAIGKRTRFARELVWENGDAFDLAVEMALPEDSGSRYNRCRYEIRIGGFQNGTPRVLAENFWVTRNPKRGWKQIISRQEDRAVFRSETTKLVLPYRLGEAIALPRATMDVDRFATAIWAYDFLSTKIRFLSLDGRAMRTPCSPFSPDYLQQDGSNLPKVVRKLREFPDLFRSWIQYVNDIIPGVQDIEVKEYEWNRHLYLSIRCNDVWFSPYLLSDGELKLLALTVLAHCPERALYLIEEPESDIYAESLGLVFRALSSARGQVFFTTHSPYLIEMARPEQVLRFSKVGRAATIKGEQK